MKVELRLLGPPVILIDGAAPSADLEWRKHKALLIYLACPAGRGRGRDYLKELLWPSGNSARSLSQALVPIRKAVGESAVISDGDLIKLAPEALTLDLDQIRALIAGKNWAAAASLVRGEFCEGLVIPGAREFEEWLTLQRREWQGTCVAVLVSRGEQLLDAGDITGASRHFQRAQELDPYSEAALRGLLRALTLDGRKSAALEEYRRFRERLREALGIEPSEETRRLVERLSGLRPRSQTTIGDSDTRRTPLVGRGKELTAATELWQRVIRGKRTSLLIVTGDPGSGKSRLCEEISTRARLDGAATAAVRLGPYDRNAPQSALLGLARGGLLLAHGLAAVTPAAHITIGIRVPEWAERYPQQGEPTLSLVEAIGQVLRTVSEEQPLLLMVDDAHWADQASFESFEAILRDHPRIPLLLLLAAEEEPRRDEIDRLGSRVGREISGITIRLKALSHQDVEEIARWIFPSYSDDQLARLVRRVMEDSAGLPFFVIELLNAVALGYDFRATGKVWPDPERTYSHTFPGGVPDSIVSALRMGFRRLGNAPRQLLQILAAIGERMSDTDLANMASQPLEVVLPDLDELEWLRWLNADAAGYSFVAQIAREVVERDMTSPGEQERLRARWKQMRGKP